MGPHQPIQWVPEGVSAEVKRQGREADHSPPSSSEVKNGGPTPPLALTSSRCGVYLINNKGNFTFTCACL
jgi:hypothetical protein